MNLITAKQAIKDCMQVGLVPLLSSAPGLGKSSLVKQIAEEMNLELIDLRLSQLEASDLNGLPRITQQHQAEFLPFSLFPLTTTSKPEKKKGWLLFLDELTNAEPQTAMAAYRLILDREVGNHPLHKDCYLVAAGNREEDNEYIQVMPSPLRTRMVHLDIHLDASQWLDYASKAHYDPRITSFIRWKPSNLQRKDSGSKSFACPRSWEFVSRLIKDKPWNDYLYELMGGLLDEKTLVEFTAYMNYFSKLPSYEEVLRAKKPSSEDNVGIQYALVSMLVNHCTLKDFPKVWSYIQNFAKELKVTLFRDLANRGVISYDTLPNYMDLIKELSQGVDFNV